MTARNPLMRHEWHSEIFQCKSNDISTFNSLLNHQLERHGFTVNTLGETNGYPILACKSRFYDPDKPSVLVSAGFHGEEPAGPWGLLHLLTHWEDGGPHSLNITLLPLVNPTGFLRGTRFNYNEENPNRGFGFKDGRAVELEDTSEEGRILISHASMLEQASRDGILTCHEDVLETGSYLYTFEESVRPGMFSLTLLDTLKSCVALTDASEIDGLPVEGHIIHNNFDTSFESYLVQAGAKVGVCSETGARQPIDLRILANSALISNFLEQIEKPI
ncbi:M14 family metallocarboxypeptidase [Parasalinivibrio latis]|uniref:M14 family metallopeptidase n=1 Tax=Parasalinivibrio latis TaxID=2952610 RepID=UPI0030E432DD